MSNFNVPAHIAARIAERNRTGVKSSLTSAIVSGGVDIPRVSTRASRFRLVEGSVESVIGINIDVIIVGVNPRVSKVFYEKQYDSAADNEAPTCFSNDGIKPDDMMQEPVSDSCANCPYNVLGSKITPSGAKSKKCSDQRHLAVVVAADPTKVYSLTVPVSGMKALREYFKDLSNYNIGPQEVVTTLGFDDEASYPKLTFKAKGFVSEKALPVIDGLLESDDAKIAIRVMPPKDMPSQLAAPAAESKPEIAKPSTPEDDEAGAYEEEVVVAEAPAKAEKPKVEPVKASDALEAQLDGLFD
jgi:hypothetical protein